MDNEDDVALLEAMFETEDPFAERAFSTVQWWQFFRAKARAILKKKDDVYYTMIQQTDIALPVFTEKAFTRKFAEAIGTTPTNPFARATTLDIEEFLAKIDDIQTELVEGLMYPYKGLLPKTPAPKDIETAIEKAKSKSIEPFSQDVIGELKKQGIQEEILVLLGPPLFENAKVLTDIENKQRQLNDLQNQMEITKQELAAATSTNKGLQQKLHADLRRTANIQADIKEKETTIALLQAELAAQKETTTAITETATASAQQMAETRRMLSEKIKKYQGELAQRLEEQQQTIEEQKSAKEKLEAQRQFVAEIEQEKYILEQKLEECQQTIEKQKQDIATLATQRQFVVETKQEKDALEQKLGELQQTIEEQKSAIETFSHTITNTKTPKRIWADFLIDPNKWKDAWRAMDLIDLENQIYLYDAIRKTKRAIESAKENDVSTIGYVFSTDKLDLLFQWAEDLNLKISRAKTVAYDEITREWSSIPLSSYPVFRILREIEIINQMLETRFDRYYANKTLRYGALQWSLDSTYFGADIADTQRFDEDEEFGPFISKLRSLYNTNSLNDVFETCIRPIFGYDNFYINVRLSPRHIRVLRECARIFSGFVDNRMQTNTTVFAFDWYLAQSEGRSKRVMASAEPIHIGIDEEDDQTTNTVVEAGSAYPAESYFTARPAPASHKMLSPAKSHAEALVILRELASKIASDRDEYKLVPDNEAYLAAYTTLLATNYVTTAIARLEMIHAIYYCTDTHTELLKAMLYYERKASDNPLRRDVRASAE